MLYCSITVHIIDALGFTKPLRCGSHAYAIEMTYGHYPLDRETAPTSTFDCEFLTGLKYRLSSNSRGDMLTHNWTKKTAIFDEACQSFVPVQRWKTNFVTIQSV